MSFPVVAKTSLSEDSVWDVVHGFRACAEGFRTFGFRCSSGLGCRFSGLGSARYFYGLTTLKS